MQVWEVKHALVGASVDAIVGASVDAIVGECISQFPAFPTTFPHTRLPPIKRAAKTLRSCWWWW